MCPKFQVSTRSHVRPCELLNIFQIRQVTNIVSHKMYIISKIHIISFMTCVYKSIVQPFYDYVDIVSQFTLQTLKAAINMSDIQLKPK